MSRRLQALRPRLRWSNKALRRDALAATLLLVSCQAEAPRELRLDVPELVTSKDPVVAHARAIDQQGNARSPRGELDFKVTPSDLASVDKRGVLACRRSGEGSVSLQIAGVSASAKFVCKLAARLDAPDKLDLDASAGERELRVAVLDAAGKELDLPVSVTSDRASVVMVRAGRLVPVNVGVAKLTAGVGSLTRRIDVEVVRTLKPEVLPIDQNRRISYSLEPGKYRLSIQLPESHPVKVVWLGAPYCAYQGRGPKHDVDCTLQGKGSVSFDNPAFLLRGDKTPSVEGVTLREVP
jgi:hypothetical protein